MAMSALTVLLLTAITADAAMLRHGGQLQIRVSTSSNSTGAGRYGSPDCACVGIDNLEGDTTATLKDGSKVDYPADLGAHCEAWDVNTHPKCTEDSPPSWCEKKWCYVDPCKCKNVPALPKPSIYLPGAHYQGKPVHFSYATCGSKDSYSAKEAKKTAKDIEKTCAMPVAEKHWGPENCRCVGIGPQPGTTKVSIQGKKVGFPADAGATCRAWDAGNHPDCSGDKPPSWCTQKWCYVDPCSCKLPTPPKTSSYLPKGNYQGKPVYYSYAACGGTDSYTSGRKEACVNQETEDDCGTLKKCAWTGKECLGKELAGVCQVGGSSKKAGGSSKKANTASRFVKSIAPPFKHRLRVCNAYPSEDALDIFKGREVMTHENIRRLGVKKQLTKVPLDYKMCADFLSPLAAGDQLKIMIGGANGGNFAISDLPNNDAVLLVVVHRHDTLMNSIAFQSHVFASLLNAQVAVIDTYKGRSRDFVQIADAMHVEKLQYNKIVALSPGNYKVSLQAPGAHKKKGLVHDIKKDVVDVVDDVEDDVDDVEADLDLRKKAHHRKEQDMVALNRESYVVLRVGVDAQRGQKFPEELVVYPSSDPALLGLFGNSHRNSMSLGMVMLIAATLFRQ